MKNAVNGTWVWRASALFPAEGEAYGERHIRKRFRDGYAGGIARQNPNTKCGIYRNYDIPLPAILSSKMVAYAFGVRKRVQHVLKKQIKSLGKKRAYGYGKIVDITTEVIPEDLSITKDGIAQRYLPNEKGTKLVRPRPPYWNCTGRVKCLNVGDAI